MGRKIRIAERLRYQRIKRNKDKYAQQKIKEREKYEKKKEKGVIKLAQHITPRDQRKATKLWREKKHKIVDDVYHSKIG